MSIQAGGQNHRRPFPGKLAETIFTYLSAPGHSAPKSWQMDGVFLAYADFALRRGVASGQPHMAHGAVITFDGRLDNRNDLRLLLRDYLRGDTSDAALALAVWRVYGVAGLVRLIGDFSLVIFDVERQQIIMASDALGTRPLYYGLTPDGVLWSTLLKQIVEWIKPDDLDDHYAAGFFLRGGCPGRTPYAGIYSVRPGQAIVVSRDGVQLHTFWRPPVESYVRYQRHSDYEEHLCELFETAVARRMDRSEERRVGK